MRPRPGFLLQPDILWTTEKQWGASSKYPFGVLGSTKLSDTRCLRTFEGCSSEDEATRGAPSPPLIPARFACAQPWGASGHPASTTSAPAALMLQGEAADKQDLENFILGGRHPKASIAPLLEPASPLFTYLWNEDYFLLCKMMWMF